MTVAQKKHAISIGMRKSWRRRRARIKSDAVVLRLKGLPVKTFRDDTHRELRIIGEILERFAQLGAASKQYVRRRIR